MVDLVEQLREVKERDFSPESLKTMVLWGADEIERLRAALADLRERSVEEGIHHFGKRIDAVLGRVHEQ